MLELGISRDVRQAAPTRLRGDFFGVITGGRGVPDLGAFVVDTDLMAVDVRLAG